MQSVMGWRRRRFRLSGRFPRKLVLGPARFEDKE